MSFFRSMKLLVLACVCALSGLSYAQAQPSGQRYTAEEYIALWKEVAVTKMKEHGIPASITLAQGLLESGNGNSLLAREGNNHFGIKCTPDWTGGKTYHDDDKKNDCFRKYKNAADSYEDHAKFLQRSRYAALFELRSTDYQGWAKGLKKAGYATDPNYPSKLIALIERYQLDNLDKGIDVNYKPSKNTTASTGKKPSSRNSGRSNRVESGTVTLAMGRSVEKFQGRIKYVRAKNGEDFRKLAQELEMTHGMLARWNDMDKNSQLEEGQVIFIQPKRNAAKGPMVHVAKEGETLWGISQEYGVKLSRLAKYNAVSEDAPLTVGQKVWLKKQR
ncbi:MAG: glucosaminidase domain-containing protein [Flavobacteriales bacterium]|nr:glucosaminidase domain-containing protein [Flavobacteriales bacterium]MBK7240556.1 glucosaminidase domain-containing protein [Flavobacteriales bacterium]MBK7297231.1 glucosaminidase domain-containing protein [Flavobacteriales bacterium]MBK9535903.1 glucosaminidase domain-containing protein [Flavobacteriales bacterium]MBP9140032.1 glucosaminidase domain-containing protein [Flavobacteriales bacterium]